MVCNSLLVLIKIGYQEPLIYVYDRLVYHD